MVAAPATYGCSPRYLWLQVPYSIAALNSAALTESGSGGAAGDEPARLLTPEMVRQPAAGN